MKIPFSKNTIGRKEIKAVKKVLKSGWITNGLVTKELEKKFAEYVGAKYAIATNSCTTALQVALRANGIKKHSFVMLPSLTFAATAEAIVNYGCNPYFVDVGDDYIIMDSIAPEAEDLGLIDAMMPVWCYGNYREVAFVKDVRIIEDSAHLIRRNQLLGSSHTACFSFYATKNMTCGEGGMIATNDEKVAQRAKLIIEHGITKDSYERYKKAGNWKYGIEMVGFKGNTNDILASIALEQLEKLPDMDKRRKIIVDYYNEELNLKNKGLHLYPILVDNQDKFIRQMVEVGISCSFHFIPLHWTKAYRNCHKGDMKNTDYLGKHLVSIPLYPSLKKEEAEYIIKYVKKFQNG